MFSSMRLVNGSVGDPVLYLDYPGRDNAILFDAGDNSRMSMEELGDLEAVFITHHHVDHFIGLDRIVRANMDRDKSLQIFGPVGTITKIYDRIKSYEYPYFPFQKIVLEVHELETKVHRVGRMECSRKFPEPAIEESPWTSPIVYANNDWMVEAELVDHTVPCLAYALVERPGWHPDSQKWASGLLRPGDWIEHALVLLRKGTGRNHVLEIQGGKFTLGQLADQYFAHSPGVRLAFVTDTVWTSEVKSRLTRLASKAWRLYCDGFYSKSHVKQAATHRHMTVTDAADFAKHAKVETLVLMHFSNRYRGQYQELVDEARAIFPRVFADI